MPKGETEQDLVVRDLIEGTGAEGKTGDILLVHYVGGVYETGKEIESGWVKGSPFYVVLGAGSFIKGWEEGIPGMKVGGRRELRFPTTPDDAPPGSELGDTLVYIIDAIGLEEGDES